MTDSSSVEHIVERVVSQVLQGYLPQLREELVRRVVEELPQEEGAVSAPSGISPADLLRAVAVIQAGSTQKEILRALLDGVSRYAGRTALFVIKAGAATGWQGRGFEDNDAVKDFALDVSRGLAERVLEEHAPFSGQIIDMDPRFVDHFGGPAADHVLLLPLLLKDKVAALVYADAGMETGGKLESAAIELLVVSTSAWLEVWSLRKQAPRESMAGPERVEHLPPPPPEHSVSSFSDPFAGHAPKHAMAAAAHASAPVASSAPVAEPDSPQAEVVSAEPAPHVDEVPPGAPSALSPDDADVHRKAQRFARLLVDEIKLYNQAKVSEGRKNKDLYDRLKEDIEKSRATYKKRYGNTAAASADYFQVELVRSLAEDDVSIMGANFRH
jgi:hypothetical protein